MSAGTSIEWTDHTFNPWHGCTKISPGCKNCYADALDARHLHGDERHWGDHAPRLISGPGVWAELERWEASAREARRRAVAEGRPEPARPRVFCLSMGDICEDRREVEQARTRVFHSVFGSELRWLLLSKRPENFGKLLWSLPPEHVALGASVENQEVADARVPALLAQHARWRFLSVEPLLERVRLDLEPRACPVCNGQVGDDHADWRCVFCYSTGRRAIDWVIVGGESGIRARDCEVRWVVDIVAQCRAAGVPVFVKQTGKRSRDGNGLVQLRKGKGDDPTTWPPELLNPDGSPIRELPEGWK